MGQPFDSDRPFSIQVSGDIEIPLSSRGTKINFESRSPTNEELQRCPKLHMTSESPWDPSEVVLQEVSKNTLKDPPIVKKITFNGNDRFQYREDLSLNDIMLNEILSLLSGINQDSLFQASGDDIPHLRTYVSSGRHNQVSAENISEILGIGPNKAKQMC